MDAVNIQTKFGLGEIVATHQKRMGNRIILDQIGEVVTIYFVRIGGRILPFGEDELIGDPDYDQEKGGYPDAAV